MKAVVLGCGPAGLFATHALRLAGWEVVIWSKKRRSEMYGAQYLHQPIPHLVQTEGKVRYILQGGGTLDYRRKVYGSQGEALDLVVSPETIDPTEDHPAWDIRVAYYDAWSLYSKWIVHKEMITGMHLGAAMMTEKPDLIVSSIPRYFLCRQPFHQFAYQSIWAIGDAPERGIFVSGPTIPDGYVLCQADPEVAWYRLSNIFGYRTIEWPKPPKDPSIQAARVKKPIQTDCDCNSDLPLIHVGRYGVWKKGVLSHSAFYDVQELISATSSERAR